MNQTAVERAKYQNKLTLTGTNVGLLKMLVRSHKNRTTTAAVGTSNGDCVEVNFFFKVVQTEISNSIWRECGKLVVLFVRKQFKTR